MGAKSKADISTGGQNPYFSANHNTTIALSVPEGAKLHCQFRWGGHGRIFPPWIRHWLHVTYPSHSFIPPLNFTAPPLALSSAIVYSGEVSSPQHMRTDS